MEKELEQEVDFDVSISSFEDDESQKQKLL